MVETTAIHAMINVCNASFSRNMKMNLIGMNIYLSLFDQAICFP